MIRTTHQFLRAIKAWLTSLKIWIFLYLANLATIERPRSFRKFKNSILSCVGVRINGDVFFDYGFKCINPKNIFIDASCSFGHDLNIWAFNRVTIGRYCQSAKDLLIINGGHDQKTMVPLIDNQDVEIGEGVWIGARVTILGGVKIGNGSIIAAGAVVTSSIPPFSIAAGVPARVIKDRVCGEAIQSPFGWFGFDANGNCIERTS